MSDPRLDLKVLYPGKYLKAEDLQGREVTVTINRVRMEAVPMTNGKREPKVVIGMAKTPKEWIVGKTNGYALALLLCDFTGPANGEEWVGKRVTLCADVDCLGKADVAAIRIAGSPDALPGRAEAYARAWRGVRRRGALVARIKAAVSLLAMGKTPPVEPEDEPIAEEMTSEPAMRDELFGEAAQ